MTHASMRYLVLVIALTAAGLATPQGGAPAPGTIVTIAGPGAPTSGGRAIEQTIDTPSAVALDTSGGFYVASSALHRVYRVTADGLLQLVAGNGISGFAGDGGPAASAQL